MKSPPVAVPVTLSVHTEPLPYNMSHRDVKMPTKQLEKLLVSGSLNLEPCGREVLPVIVDTTMGVRSDVQTHHRCDNEEFAIAAPCFEEDSFACRLAGPPASQLNSSVQVTLTEQEILLPEAVLVDEPTSEIADIQSVEVYIPDKYSLTIAGRNIHIGVLVLPVLLIIAVAIGFSSKESDTLNASFNQNMNISQSFRNETVIKHDIETNILRRNLTFRDLPQSDDRRIAMNWILNGDAKKLNATDPTLHQRYILALLAYQYGSSFASKQKWLSDESECEWGGVTCVNGSVHKLELGMILYFNYIRIIHCNML
jgi:hypothetical protein